MPVFAYSAVDHAERRISGTLIAESPADGRQRLRERGLSIQNFRAAASAKRANGRGLPIRRRLDRLAELARHLSLLLHAGVPLAESLDVLSRQGDRRLTEVVLDLRDRIGGGASLAEALAQHPRWFDGLFISAVRMGELSGTLEESLQDLAEHLVGRQALRNRMSAALAYPMILVIVGLGVVLFLMSYVVPQLLAVLTAADRPLPASTMLLKGFSDVLMNHGAILAISGALAAGIAILLYRNRSARRRFQGCLLRLPVWGPLQRKSLVAHFAQPMALLLKTGVPFVDAVRSVAGSCRNLVLREELEAMAEAVECGSDIAPTIARSRVFPAVVSHLVAVGQDSGELPAMLGQLRDRYDVELRLAVNRFATVLEPLLIVVLAAVVGFVVFACLMPILEATRGIA